MCDASDLWDKNKATKDLHGLARVRGLLTHFLLRQGVQN
jgi:hypothetical protein